MPYRHLLVALPIAVGALDAVAQAPIEKVSPLPLPTGAQPLGTAVAYLTDSTRRDQDFPRGRPITLQLWYPARSGANAPTRSAPYLVEPALGDMLLRIGYYGVDSAVLRAWTGLETHSTLDARPVNGAHPLLAFSVGLGVARANYTSLAEELASWGYIVAMVESPMQGVMLLPSGVEVMDTAGKYGEPAAHRLGVAAWSADISFVLDRLRTGLPGAAGGVGSVVDWSRIGAFGHSTGGLVAVATCESDRRVRACVNLDGGAASPDQEPLADFVTKGVSKPTLFLRSQPLYDDTTLTRRGMTRAQWEKRGEAGTVAFQGLASRSKELSFAAVAGTGHFSYSDAPFVMSSAITRFGGRIIDPKRGWTVITGTIRAFFDQQLRGEGGGVAAILQSVPELTLGLRRPQR